VTEQRLVAVLGAGARDEQDHGKWPFPARQGQSAGEVYPAGFIVISNFLFIVWVGLLWLLRSDDATFISEDLV